MSTIKVSAMRVQPDLGDLSRAFWALVWASLPFLALLTERISDLPSSLGLSPEVTFALTVGFAGNVAFVPLLAIVHGRLAEAGIRWRGWLIAGLVAALPLIVFHVAVLFVSLLQIGAFAPRAMMATGALAGILTTMGVLISAIAPLASLRPPAWVAYGTRAAGVATALLQAGAMAAHQIPWI
jgi:hypothetical protein